MSHHRIIISRLASLHPFPVKGWPSYRRAAKHLSMVVLTTKNKEEVFRDTEIHSYNYVVYTQPHLPKVAVTLCAEPSPKRRGETQ